MNFLVDECLPPDLVEVARAANHDASFVPHIGKGADKDWGLALFAIEQEMVIVTNNSKDFRGANGKPGFTTAELIHPGLVCLNCEPDRRNRRMFVKLFKLALAEIGEASDMINTVVEVTQIGDEVEVNRYTAPELI